ncbi:MAG: winged helix-turn-helix transcriptional regulator [Candidatus Methanoperedens sp.]
MTYTEERKTVCENERPDMLGKRIILCLAKNNETLDRRDIAERIGNPYQTVKYGLKKLENEGVLEKPFITKEIGRGKGKTKSHTQGYKLKESIDVFIKLLFKYFDDTEFKEFHRSAYCQNMINTQFVKNIKSKWNYPDDEFIRNRYLTAIFFDGENGRLYEKTSEHTGVKILDLPTEKRLEMANEHIKGSLNYLLDFVRPYLSDEDIMFLLKSSPSALNFSLTDLFRDTALSELKNDRIFFAPFKFQWNDGTGRSDIYIKNFLISEGIDWVKDARIELWPTITVTDGKNSLFFRRDNKQEKVYLKTDKKSYVFDIVKDEKSHSEWIVLTYPEYKHLDEKSLAKILEILPENQKRKYYRKAIEYIHEIFLEQLLMNFISDIRLDRFVSQNTYSTWLDVSLSVRFCLNGKKKLHKAVEVGRGETDYRQHPNPELLTGEFDECKD